MKKNFATLLKSSRIGFKAKSRRLALWLENDVSEDE